MRKVISLAFVFVIANLSLVACSFEMHTGDPKHPAPPPPGNTAAPAATPVAPAAQPAGRGLLSRHRPTPTPSSTSTAPAPAPTAPPSGAAIVSTPIIFGGPTPDPNGFKGSIFWIPAGTTNVPTNLGTMTPNGFLFASQLNVTPQAFTTGFPGVDPAHTTNFAIRYEAPLIVTAEADYDFRVLTDDGAILSIDNTPIVNNDGVKSAAADKDGPVHLVAGTHMLTVDYFQTSGNVALQVFCKKANGTEQICPTHL